LKKQNVNFLTTTKQIFV